MSQAAPTEPVSGFAPASEVPLQPGAPQVVAGPAAPSANASAANSNITSIEEKVFSFKPAPNDVASKALPPVATFANGVNLDFMDISYTVQKKSENIPILRGVSGTVKAGNMLCLLGPSGSGKTSLIQVISRRLVHGGPREIKGDVLCNMKSCTATEFQRISGLVTQEDVFNGVLSVAETLKFSAQLKLPPGLRKERVDKVVERLQLGKCLNTWIGDDSNPASKGISGGEKRRLAIAIEILNPEISILVADEPTSGLDAAAALNVTNILRELANTGITVLATLHQPRHNIMQRFERLMVMSAGRRVYYGSVEQYVPYLEQQLQCVIPMHASPYDLLLDALNPAIGLEDAVMKAVPESCPDIAECLATLFEQSALAQACTAADLATREEARKSLHGSGLKPFAASWAAKFWTLLMRTFIIKTRDPIVLMTLMSSAIMMGLIFGTLYWQCYDREQQYVILDTQMAVTMVIIMIVFLPYDVTLTFPKERSIFLRERKAGLYGTSSFYFARILCDMPLHIITAVIFGSIVWGMAGLKTSFVLWSGTCILAILVGASLMQMVGALSRTFEEANLLMMLILMLSMVMTSSFVRDVPAFLKWLRSISIMGIISDMAMYFEFSDVDPKFGTTDEVLSHYAVKIRDDDDLFQSCMILLAIFVFARLVTFLSVKFLFTGRSFAEDLRD